VPIILTVGPPLLMGLYAATKVRERKPHGEDQPCSERAGAAKEGAHE
jgi:hypothetical protein